MLTVCFFVTLLFWLKPNVEYNYIVKVSTYGKNDNKIIHIMKVNFQNFKIKKKMRSKAKCNSFSVLALQCGLCMCWFGQLSLEF